MGEREQSVGWSTLALLLFFVGFGVACVGVAALVAGVGTAGDVALAALGSVLCVGSGISYVPLWRRDNERDHAQAAERRAARVPGPLGPGSELDRGHIWHMHAIRIVAPLVFLIFAIPIVSFSDTSPLKWGWLALTLMVTYLAWTMEYAVALSVTPEGILLRRITGTRELKYCEIHSATVFPSKGEMPSTLVVSTSKDYMSPKFLIPLFDERLLGLIFEHVSTIGGHA